MVVAASKGPAAKINRNRVTVSPVVNGIEKWRRAIVAPESIGSSPPPGLIGLPLLRDAGDGALGRHRHDGAGHGVVLRGAGLRGVKRSKAEGSTICGVKRNHLVLFHLETLRALLRREWINERPIARSRMRGVPRVFARRWLNRSPAFNRWLAFGEFSRQQKNQEAAPELFGRTAQFYGSSMRSCG